MNANLGATGETANLDVRNFMNGSDGIAIDYDEIEEAPRTSPHQPSDSDSDPSEEEEQKDDSQPAIKCGKVITAFTCLAQNIIHNVFFYFKFEAYYGISAELDRAYSNLSYVTTVPIGIFMRATGTTFVTSILPAVIPA